MSLAGFILLAGSSLFVSVNPLSAVPAFIAMTASDTLEQRVRMARVAACVVAGVLLVFAIAGEMLFKLLGLTLPAFEIAASIVLLLIALDMLRAQSSRVQQTHEETAAGMEKPDIAVTPLAVPMLSGPGAISTVILLQHEAAGWPQNIALYACILTVAASCYGLLHLAARGAKWFGPIAMNLAVRIMGLLLAAVAVQFMLNALKSVRAEWLAPPPL